MNSIITPINFQGKIKNPNVKSSGDCRASRTTEKLENDVRKLIQRTTTPGIRKAIIGAASFAAVLFASKRCTTWARKVLFKLSPKTEESVHTFFKKAKPFWGEFGNNLKKETKNFLSGENFSNFVSKITKKDKTAKKIISDSYNATRFVGHKAEKAAKNILNNPNKTIDYTGATIIALLSGSGFIKLDDVAAKRKLEKLFGDEQETGRV